jgi:hypothetical protein
MNSVENKKIEERVVRDIPVRRQSDPTTAIEIKYVQALIESDFRYSPVPLLRERAA